MSSFNLGKLVGSWGVVLVTAIAVFPSLWGLRGGNRLIYPIVVVIVVTAAPMNLRCRSSPSAKIAVGRKMLVTSYTAFSSAGFFGRYGEKAQLLVLHALVQKRVVALLGSLLLFVEPTMNLQKYVWVFVVVLCLLYQAKASTVVFNVTGAVTWTQVSTACVCVCCYFGNKK